MEIRLFSNQNAKKYMEKILKNHNDLEPEFYNHVKRWLEEPRDVKCYSLNDSDHKENVGNIILLSKCDYDPQKYHTNPFLLDYIYTFVKYRRNNLAYKMLSYIKTKTKEQVTAFCSNEESEHLFKKAEYVFSGYDPIMNIVPMYRFP
jgi:hypothetical protein